MNRKIVFTIIALILILTGVAIGNWGVVEPKFKLLDEYNGEKTTNLSAKAIYSDDSLILDNENKGKTNYANRKIYVDENFTTRLPLVIIDTYGKKPKLGVSWDSNRGYFVPKENVDVFTLGEIKIVDGELNSISSTPTMCSNIKIKIRGNSSCMYDKKQYLIKTVDESGKSIKKNILNLGNGSDWVLNISLIDKSLMRNYLSLSTAKLIRPETSDARYCEVVWKSGDIYSYEGVYLMIERVSIGKNRINLPRYFENTENVSALFRRDRYNPNDTMLETFAEKNGLANGKIGVIYPNKEILSEKSKVYLTDRINEFERVLYSENPIDFYDYSKYINIDSFIDYFIINEYFLNYDAGYYSTYFYIDVDGKITIGPVWDFDQGIDNGYDKAANLYATALQSAPWFDRLLRDPVFTERLIERYRYLRKGVLSSDSMDEFIDSIDGYLKPAIERDWARWGYYYKADIGIRNRDSIMTTTHSDEVNKIKYVLREHSKWLDKNIDNLYKYKSMSLDDARAFLRERDKPTKSYNTVFAIAFIVIFFVSINLVTKLERDNINE